MDWLKEKSIWYFLDGAKEGLEIVLRYISNTYRVICCNRNIKKFRYNRCNCKFIKSNSKFNKFPKWNNATCTFKAYIWECINCSCNRYNENYGVDSSIGLIASTIMGSTETTLYTIAVYSSSVRIKKQDLF